MDAIHCIIKITLNLFDVARCNGLHHKNRDIKIEMILICNHFCPNGMCVYVLTLEELM